MNKEFLIIAHRGESFDAPENTMAAINLAWQRDDDAVEIDIQLSKDDKIVVIHDKNTYRTGGKYKPVKSQNYNELELLDVGSFKSKKYENEGIPLLKSVVNSLPPKKYLFIEIKSAGDTTEILEEFFSKNNANKNYIKFISFNKEVLTRLKTSLPGIEAFWILDDKIPFFAKNTNSIINQCKAAKLDGLDLNEKMIKSEKIVRKILNENLKLYTWTVDDVERAKELMNWKLNGITSNKAAWLKKQLDL